MATSGTLTTSKDTAYGTGRYYTLSWTATQSVANNTSTISWTLTAAGFYGWVAEWSTSVVIDGTTVFSDSDWVARYNGTVATGSLTLTHSSDGTRSFSASVKIAVYDAVYYVTGDATWTLDTIPRASSLSVPTVTLGSAATLTVTKASSSFTHTITVKVGSSSSQTICTKSSSTSISWTPAIATYAPYITTATSATATYTIETFSGTTSVGTATTTGTMKVPSSVVPTISGVTLTDVGQSFFSGTWVASLSKVKAVISAAAAYSSAIGTYKYEIDGLSASGSSSTLTFSSALASSGTVTGKATVTDARSRSTTYSSSITVYAYSAPSINIDLSMTETTLTAAYTWAVSSVNSKNTKALSIVTKRSSDSKQVDSRTISLSSSSWSGTGSFSLTLDDLQYETYVVTATLTDKVQTVTYTANSGQVALSLRAGGLRAAFFGQQGSASKCNLDNFLQILGKQSGEGDIGVAGIDPVTGLAVTGAHIGAGRQNHGVYSYGYVTDDDLANGTYTSDALWEIYRNSSGQITIGDSSHPTYARGGVIASAHDSAIGTVLSVTAADTLECPASSLTDVQSLTLPAGTWLVIASSQPIPSASGMMIQVMVATSSGGWSNHGQTLYSSGTGNYRLQAARIISGSGSTTVYHVIYPIGNSCTLYSSTTTTMYAVRIA